ncbi:unnamed protein product [Rotaria socialis]|uniref:BZIP domain-containing protein n=1 Tax=Rotaria socialis TaxID=392032 RepID=A0A820VUV4_9BILA|nr:unnamed protein product [Rotaria socialis]CAF3463985.1 unnamed protein product [Rotaria socialis]CAF4507523.1 unnamed protein product [Rotaria socialis]CAF4581947.1 unnamed protein product [Rotaria socialis]
MQFPFNQTGDLLTPNIKDVCVTRVNSILASSDAFSLDDNDIHFSSLLLKSNEYTFPPTKDNNYENNDNNEQQQQYDLFSTFEFPVLSELDKTDLQMEFSEFEKYLTQSSIPCSETDVHDSSISNDPTLWVGEECTIDSESRSDMMVPPSPSISLSSESSSTHKSTKKTSLTIIERKLRKKDQNKSAAEKYRKKKQVERSELLARHAALKSQNQELKFELDNLTYRLESFKQLFVDVLQVKVPLNESK